MGFNGLEKFIDSFYNKRNVNQIYVNIALKNCKFVIDGDDLAHIILSWNKNAHYGGNYDQMYNSYQSLLIKLKPYTEIVIFNTEKNKTDKLLNKQVYKLAHLEQDDENYFSDLKQYPPLFTKNILYQVLNDLNINYSIVSEMGNNSIACYANGYGSIRGNYTVLAKDSIFSIYKLEKGYLSWKYASDIFKNDINDDTLVPIFNLNNLLSFFEINLKSWHYFCVLNGNYDYNLYRNIKYLKTKRIDTKYSHNLFPLFEHIQKNQKFLLTSNFAEIRSTYDHETLTKIDSLINMFEFKYLNINFKFISSIDSTCLNEYDIFINCLRSNKQVYFKCLIEDFNENSVFYNKQVEELLYLVYSQVKKKYFQDEKRLIINEYYRVKDPAKDKQLIFKRDIRVHEIESNDLIKYLQDKSEFSKQNNIVDYLSLFLFSINMWSSILNESNILKDLNINKSILIEALLTNFIIINFKSIEILNFNLDENEEIILARISNIYEEIISKTESNDEIEFKKYDLKLIHLINQFQAVYFTIGLFKKIFNLNLEILSPHKFLNSFFILKYVKDLSSKNESLITLIYELNDLIHKTRIFETIKIK